MCMHCLGFSLSVRCHAYAFWQPRRPGAQASPCGSLPHASSKHCGLSSGPHARRGTGGKGKSEAEPSRGVQIVQWQQCNAKRGQSTAGQPGTLLLPVACGGAGQSGMSLAVWRPVARGAGARERTRARPPWSSPLSSRLMSSTCLDPGGLAWTRPAPRCLPLIIDEDSMLRLRAVASSACIAFRAQLRGSGLGLRPGRAALLLPSSRCLVWSLSISFAVARCHGIHGRARCSDGEDQDRRGAAAETRRPVGSNVRSLRQMR